jgi:hypothetical protein
MTRAFEKVYWVLVMVMLAYDVGLIALYVIDLVGSDATAFNVPAIIEAPMGFVFPNFIPFAAIVLMTKVSLFDGHPDWLAIPYLVILIVCVAALAAFLYGSRRWRLPTRFCILGALVLIGIVGWFGALEMVFA